MKFSTKKEAKELTGLNYLGSVNMTAKHKKGYKYNELVYGLYLSPAKSSGYEVCKGRTPECSKLCLHESGLNRIDTKLNRINKSRITKTKLFFEHREFFVRWMISEIETVIKRAEREGFEFSIRLNNTSDISPTEFYIIEDGQRVNILELYPNIQFYDYTKVDSRITLPKLYSNYDLTYSFNGQNKDVCLNMLESNIRVAVVFKNVPETFWGYKVIDGDLYDMRYRDKKNVIVGLKFKTTRTKLPEKTSFVIQ
jgi:hypothetical protein